MPETASYNVQTSVGGVTYIQAGTVSGTNFERATPTVAAAKTGTLTTRTDANTGVITMTSGHGFTTGNKVDVFWSGGSRRNMDATVATDAVTVDGGSGDDLPALNSSITAMVPTEAAFSVDATSTGVSVIASCPVNGFVVFRDGSDAVIYTCQVRAGALTLQWVTGMGTNPLASAAVANVLFSHADSTQSQTLAAVVVF